MLKQSLSWFSKTLLHHSSLGAYFEPIIQLFKPHWRDGYYRAKVVSIEQLVANSIALTLKVDASWPLHKAGQHIELTLELNGKLVTRVFTIASSPSDVATGRTLRLVIKCQKNGLLTQNLTSLNAGNWVNLSAPYGEFHLQSNGKPSLLLAAGSGITPIIAMLLEAKKLSNSAQNLHLIYYAKHNEHMLIEELEALTNVMPNFSYQLLTRGIDGDVYQYLSQYKEYEFYVCGPTEFYQSVAQYAGENNKQLYSEHFSLTPIHTKEQQEFDVSIDGKQLALNNSSPILTQLLERGEKVNYGCKMGICHQCQCKKKSGVVKNIRTGELSDRGEELIQLCVSQVLTDLELEA